MAEEIPAENTPPSLAERVAAAQSRIAERTAPARQKMTEQGKIAVAGTRNFVKEHPLLTVTGAVVAGAAIAFALPGKSGRKLRGSAMAFGGLIAELAATYGSRMIAMTEDAAAASQEKLGKIGESFAEGGEAIAHAASDIGDAAMQHGRAISSKIKR